jgi:Holliday junction DNA helicase RuvA
MIGYIQGEIVFLDLTYAVIEAGGIGYEIKISINTYTRIKDLKQVRLYTHLHIKEDAHVLYGFFDVIEKNLFTQLISISGVGPGTAIMILSSMEVNEIEEAIAGGDLVTLKGIKGIGQKTAERIIVELKDKIRKTKGLEKSVEGFGDVSNELKSEALSALVTLGIQKSAAEKTIQSILRKQGNNITLEELIKLALKTA